MHFFKIALCSFLVSFLAAAMAQAQNTSISQAAEKLASIRDKKAELEKDAVKTGQTINGLGSLSIDDFLELEAVPDGLDPVSADALYRTDEAFDFMTMGQAITSIQIMRGQGVELPENLEEDIRKNPDQMSKIMFEAFQKIPAPEIKSKEDIDKYRRNAIRAAEESTGIEFKELLKQQKKMMTFKD